MNHHVPYFSTPKTPKHDRPSSHIPIINVKTKQTLKSRNHLNPHGEIMLDARGNACHELD